MSEMILPAIIKDADGKPLATIFTAPVTLTSNEAGAGDYGAPLSSLECCEKAMQSIYASAMKPKEADGATAFPGVSRGTIKTTEAGIVHMSHFLKKNNRSKESVIRHNIKFKVKILEQDAKLPNSFKVLLIEEGLGNLGTCFYYTKEALQSAPEIFEGKKCFANHPSESEQIDRPERDVRDIIGHFEDVKFVDNQGRGNLMATLEVLPDPTVLWARSKLNQAIEYGKKYPDKYFVGLSINADGDSTPMSIQKLKSSVKIPTAAMGKINEAVNMGIDEVNLVSLFLGAMSCDLVTDPGAGGKVLSAAG